MADRVVPQSRAGRATRLLHPGVVVLVYVGLIALYVAWIHPWMMSWGATPEEQRMALPGDELMAPPDDYYTRAITIDAPPPVVWQWINQIGQDRAGFYSNDWLENLFGADMPRVDELRPEWGPRAVGDRVPMSHPEAYGGAPGDAIYLPIRAVEPHRMITNLPGRFVLEPIGEHGTRLLLREPSYGPQMGEAFAYWVWDPLHFVMEQRMLRGLKERAEGVPLVPPAVQVVVELGWVLAGLCILGLFLSRRRYWPWLAIPLPLVAVTLVSTRDPRAALAGFLALGITVAGALVFGRKWWSAYTYVGALVLLALLFAPDAYAAFGLLFALAAAVIGLIAYRARRPLGRAPSQVRQVL